VTKARDGKIWFVNSVGISVLDPHHLPVNRVPPPVHIEQIFADNKRYNPAAGLRLPSRIHYLAIDYTALSLAAPEAVRFRYRLEGVDPKWREVIDERKVQYSNLSPGHYRFRVIAANNSGLWNEQGDTLEFDVLPAWYQTLWFRAAYVLAFFMLLWALYRYRVHQLQEQEAKFREVVETMPAMAFVAEPGGNRTFVNRRWLKYTGLNSERASGSGWEKAVHPDDLKRVVDRWRAAQTTGQPLEYEVRVRQGSDGTYRWFQTRAEPLRDKRGKIVKWYAVATDIEDRKRAEQLQSDLAHVNRISTLGELAASISHELKQPITAAVLNASAALLWLKHDPPNVTEASEVTNEIINSGKRAGEIIDRLRSFYKKTLPKQEPLDLNKVIGKIIEMLRAEAARHRVSVHADLAGGLPTISGDSVQIQQVVMNLMLNGIEAMNETGGVLTVKSQSREDGQIQISVKDTGPGLPPDETDRIFDAFFTTKPQGSGMGLAICKSIIESHGGCIWASGSGGTGATFHLTLPPAPAETNLPIDAA
jgi:PAS domain S-box-containing protein